MAISSNKENYIKTIFELSYDQQKLTNKNIADILGVSAPSVTEMMATLKKEDLVTHTPYNEIALTKKGAAMATDMIRKHRLWETFLYNKLDYDIADVHQAADILEHATDNDLYDRLNKFLGFPKHCPHGGIIPGNAPASLDQHLEILKAIPDNETIQIVRVIDNHEFLTYFSELGLSIGEKLTVIRHQPFDGPVEVKTEKNQLKTISLNSASYIFVKKI